MRTSALMDVFWELLETFYEESAYLITKFRGELLEERARIYAEYIMKEGAPLEESVSFIDCMKIAMERQSGPSALHRNEYSGQKRFNLLIYQTIQTQDGHIFQIFGLKVGRRL